MCIRDRFIDNLCSSIDNEYKVQIYIHDCQKTLDYILKAQGCTFDIIGCKVKMNLNESNENESKVDILSKTYFWDTKEGYFEYALSIGRIPKMLQVKELTFLSKTILFLYFVIVYPIINFVIKPIIAIINAIISFINTLGAGLDEIGFTFFDRIENDVIGAGEYTVVYYAKDILEFWCTKAGLTFKSSILQNAPYSDMAIFSQMFTHGIDIDRCQNVHVNEQNAPNYNALEILNLLKEVFNAEWEIIGNELIFERKDYFENTKVKLFNLEDEIKKGNIKEYEIGINADKNCARFIAEFKSDSFDTQGNRAMPFYRTIQEYNEGLIYKNRKGDCSPKIAFGPVRFTEDVHKNSFNSWAWSQAHEGGWLDVGSCKFTHSVVMSNDTAQNMKLIIVDNDQKSFRVCGGCKFQVAVKSQSKPGVTTNEFGDNIEGDWEYNQPLWMSTLYNKFHFIENPDLKNHRVVEIGTIIWTPDNFCESANLLDLHKLNTKIESINYNDGFIGDYKIDYEKCNIILNNLTFKCGTNN